MRNYQRQSRFRHETAEEQAARLAAARRRNRISRIEAGMAELEREIVAELDKEESRVRN